MSEQALLYSVVFIIFMLAFIIFLLVSRKQTADSSSNEMMLQLLAEMRKEMQQRTETLTQQMLTQQRHTSQNLLEQNSNSQHLVQDITGKLMQLEHTNKRILGFAEQMKSLEKILQNPKQRGILGEYFLEASLASVLGQNQYKMQYRFSNKEIVDAAVFFRDKIVPIDSKFSLEKYNQMQTTSDKIAKKRLERQFAADVKARIDETSKYIRPVENTTDFALMFVPAEGVYHYLINSENMANKDMIAYAFQKKVIIVSPMSFYAYLQTILHALKALEVEESIKEVLKKIDALGQHLTAYETFLHKIGKNLGTSINMYHQATKEFAKIDKDIFKISKGKQGGQYEAFTIDKNNKR
ncbi:MAG: DNA recombination protein RmuC [Chitinophagales bacterium]